MKIADLPFEPRVTEEAKKTWGGWFKRNKKNFSYTANYAFVKDDGSIVNMLNNPCHGGVRGFGGNTETCAVVTSLRSQASASVDNPLHESFYTWLTQTGVFARFILEYTREYVVVSADIPCPLMQNILIATRHFYEKPPSYFEAFNRMCEMGVNPNLAVLFTWGTSLPIVSGEYQVKNSATGHVVWSKIPTMSMIERLAVGDFGVALDNHVKAGTFREKADFAGGSTYGMDEKDVETHTSIFGTVCYEFFTKDLLTNNEQFRDIVRKSRGEKTKEEEGYKPPNPFTRQARIAKIDPLLLNSREFYELFIPWLLDNVKGARNND